MTEAIAVPIVPEIPVEPFQAPIEFSGPVTRRGYKYLDNAQIEILPVLPLGTRFASRIKTPLHSVVKSLDRWGDKTFTRREETGWVFIIEYPPSVRKLTYDRSERYEDDPRPKTETGKVSIPWTYWICGFVPYLGKIQLTSFHPSWSPVRVHSIQELLYPSLLPNVHTMFYQGVCLGKTVPREEIFGERYGGIELQALVEVTERIVSSFYLTTFNDELNGIRYPDHYDSLAAWQEASEKDVLCYKKWRWTGGKTIQSLLTDWSSF